MEIIVVDNASTDGSPDCVRDQFPHVRLILNDQNLGFAKANNLGIAQCTGHYVCLVNSDVKVLKDCLTQLVDCCERHPQVGMVGPRVIGGDGELQRSCRGFPGLWNMLCAALALDLAFPRVRMFGGYALPYWSHDTEATVDILSGCFWLIRREALNQVGLLDESFFMYGEDMDWCRRFWESGWKLAFIPSAEAIHHGGASSANAPVRFHLEQQRANLQYWRKHHPPPVAAGYFLILLLHQALRVAGFSLALCFGGKQRPAYDSKLKAYAACLGWMLSGRGLDAPVRELETAGAAPERASGNSSSTQPLKQTWLTPGSDLAKGARGFPQARSGTPSWDHRQLRT
jgi:hypothetical protein